jgi:hypothetical protein
LQLRFQPFYKGKEKMKRTYFATNILRTVAIASLSLLSMGAFNAATAGVVTLTDTNPGDLMKITGIPNNTANGITVTESYGESKLIPYNSLNPIVPDAAHYAVVTQADTFFDSIVSYTGLAQGQLFEFEFQITNNTPYGWKDYHFEIWNTTFTARQHAPWASPNPPANIPTLYSDQFTGLTIHPNVGTFYSAAGSGETHEVLEVGSYTLRMELFSFNNTGDGEFGLRQVATATPEPGSLAIFGIGCSLVMAVRRRRSGRLAAKESPQV